MKKRITLAATFRNMDGDHTHWCRLYKKRKGLMSFLSFLLLTGTIAIGLYRIAHYFYGLHIRPISRLFQFASVILTGADINSSAEIGKGCILFHTVGMIITGKVGENMVASICLHMGGDGTAKDVGGGPGLPVIGDNVQIGPDVMMLGPLKVGDGSRILARAVIMKDIPPNSKVVGSPARVIGEVDPDTSIFERRE